MSAMGPMALGWMSSNGQSVTAGAEFATAAAAMPDSSARLREKNPLISQRFRRNTLFLDGVVVVFFASALRVACILILTIHSLTRSHPLDLAVRPSVRPSVSLDDAIA